MHLLKSIICACLVALVSASAAVEEVEGFYVDVEKGLLTPQGCPCGLPAPVVQHQWARRRSSSSSSSSSSCGCVAKPPYPMPPRKPCCRVCSSSSSSSSSSSCEQHYPTICPKRKALETVVALDKAFIDLINQGQLDEAKMMLSPGATYTNLDEVAEGPVCEESTGLIATLLTPACVKEVVGRCPAVNFFPWVNPNALVSFENTWLIDYLRCAKYNGNDNSVTTTNVEISYVDRDVLTAARESARTWVPTYGCNFRLAHWSMVNLVCKPQVIRDILDQ